PRHPRSPPFPYTTLFRSRYAYACRFACARQVCAASSTKCLDLLKRVVVVPPRREAGRLAQHAGSEAHVFEEEDVRFAARMLRKRSEEHTSELQSRGHLVC